MPDYKRKKVKKPLFHKNLHTDSFTSPAENKGEKPVKKEKMRVVKGSKVQKKRVNRALVAFVSAICILIVVLSIALPVGLRESLVNLTARMGNGKFPVDISGSTVLNSVSKGSYYYVLTDTSVMAYSKNGKVIFNELHGFSNPIITTSQTRALVYDQGGNFASIYNLGGKINSYESEYEIITANISRDGTVAFATHSDKYTSVLKVYDKDLDHIFTWNSAKDIINNVLINNKGNRVAVSTFNVVSGLYSSKMQILEFDSADPVYSIDLDTSIVLSLTNTGRGISVVCADKYKHINWSKFTTNEIVVSGEINLLRNTENGVLLVMNRPNNRADNTVVLISNSGKKEKEFKINSIITDIQYSKSRVYYITDSNVEILDKDGNLLRKNNTIYGTEKFTVLSPNSIAVIVDRKIEKIDIQKGEN